MNSNNPDNYDQHYSEPSLWDKLKGTAQKAGEKVVYMVLLLYYVMKSDQVDLKTKASIFAALGYFILPTDAIFDLTPLIGYSDDLGVLWFALTQLKSQITPEVKERARQKLNEWFDKPDEESLKEVDDKL